MNEQTATNETNPSAKPEGEGSSAQDLDSLLNQFDSETNEQTTTTEAKPQSGKSQLEQWAERKMQEEAEAEVRQGITEAVTSIKSDLDLNLPEGLADEVYEGILYAKAGKHPEITKAFMERKQNPKAWGSVVDAIRNELKEKIQKSPDPRLTRDREAVMAAVRNQPNTEPDSDFDSKAVKRMTLSELHKAFPGLNKP